MCPASRVRACAREEELGVRGEGTAGGVGTLRHATGASRARACARKKEAGVRDDPSPRGRSCTSAFPRPAPPRSGAPTQCTRLPRCKREYSLWPRDAEAALLPLLRELGIGFVPYSPLGHGFLTGTIRSPEQLADDDWRKNNPSFTEGNLEQNPRIIDEVEAVDSEVGATPAQIALAWLLAQGDDIAPIPGTKRVSRVEENTAADRIELSPEQIERLNNLTPATGQRHEEANMAVTDRDSLEAVARLARREGRLTGRRSRPYSRSVQGAPTAKTPPSV